MLRHYKLFEKIRKIRNFAFLEEVCCCGWALRFHSPLPGLVSLSLSAVCIQGVSSQLCVCLPAAMLPEITDHRLIL